jgi:hypothetical protein
LGIKQVDDVFQAIPVSGKQGPKLLFKYDFLLQASVTLEGFSV